MSFLRRLLGLGALERRVEDLSGALDRLTDRVGRLERRPKWTCRDWDAWHDRMPGGNPKLHVVGRCEFPTGGYEARLERHEPQGFNPHDLLLDLVVIEPTGVVTPAETEEEVRYEEETAFDYRSVTVLPEGPTVSVKTAH